MRGMAAPRSVPGLDPDEPFGAAAGRVVTVRADELWDMAHRVRSTAEADAVHDMRVASRRLRAALEVFAICFPKKRHRAVLADVKALTDALGARRDPDVLLEALAPLRETLGRQEQPGVAALTEALAEERSAGGVAVEAALAEAERTDLGGRIEELVRSVRT
jgi:CHAD domain-containing protein